MDNSQDENESVVVVHIVGQRVTVNAQPVEHDGSGDLIGVGVRAVALRFARMLQRPVPTIVIHGGASHRLLVHPDGGTSDVEPLGRDDQLGISTAPPPVPSSSAARVASARRSNGNAIWTVVATAIAVILVVGLLTWVLVLVRDDDGEAAKGTNSTPTASQTPTASATASATPTTKPKPPAKALRIRAKATAGRTTLTLRIAVSRPTGVTVRLVPSKTGKASWRRITKIGKAPLTLTFRKLPAGSLRWSVMAGRGISTSGTTKVLPRA
jgi:hypothetical protein